MSDDNLTETRSLRCSLTEKEVAERAQELAALVPVHDSLEEEKKETAKALKEKIEATDRKIRELSDVVRHKHEYRQVECRWMFTKNTAKLVRVDNYETVESRPLTKDEAQMRLDLAADLDNPSAH